MLKLLDITLLKKLYLKVPVIRGTNKIVIVNNVFILDSNDRTIKVNAYYVGRQ